MTYSGRQLAILIAAMSAVVLLFGAVVLTLRLTSDTREMSAVGPTEAGAEYIESKPAAEYIEYSSGSDVAPTEAVDPSGFMLDADPEGNPIVAGELNVVYVPGTTPQQADELNQRLGAQTESDLPGIDFRNLSFPEIKAEPSQEAREQALEQKKYELEQDPIVEAVGYNYLRWAA